MGPSVRRTKQLYAQLWSMLLLCGLHIPREILNCLNLCKIGQHVGFVAVAGVHGPIHGLYLQLSDCCSQLNLPTLESRRQYLSISFLHNIYHQRTSIKFNCHCKFNSISSTRSHLSINPPQSTINSRRYSFFVNTVFLWNSVPLTILNDPNPKSFRHSLYHYVCFN